MEYGVSYNICAVVIFIVIIAVFHMRKTIPNYQNRLFVMFLYSSFISTVADLIAAIGERYLLLPVSLLVFLNLIYFLFRNVVPMFYALYIISITNPTQSFSKMFSGIKKVLFALPLAAAYIVILLSPFLGFVFYFNDSLHYTRGPLIWICYLSSAFYMFFGFFLALVNAKRFPPMRRIALMLFFFIAIGAVAMQLIFPNVLLESFGISICILLILQTIQRPDEHIDAQTGMLNKSAFLDMTSQNLNSESQFYLLSVRILDINYLNSSLGIVTVSGLLRKISNFFTSIVKADNVYRIDDSCFCIFLGSDKELSLDNTRLIVERFKDSWQYEDLDVSLPSSCCLIDCPTDAGSIEDIMRFIDLSASDKHHSPLMLASMFDVNSQMRINSIDALLKNAVSRNLFEVYYQPIFSTKHGTYNSAEALLRMKDPISGDFIPPDEFIPIAEQNGTIIKIGLFVLESVFRFVTENDLDALGLDVIHVNLSAVQCIQTNLVEKILQLKELYNINPKHINLEITETAATFSPDILQRNVKTLTEHNFHFSLDDFGSGYSNLSFMLDLPFGIIKLDKSIVQSAFVEGRGANILMGSVAMIKELNMQIVAEGIETEEQANLLASLGCEYLQGYHFARPLPQDNFLELLNSHSVLKK